MMRAHEILIAIALPFAVSASPIRLIITRVAIGHGTRGAAVA
jgi:hypothetical protein